MEIEYKKKAKEINVDMSTQKDNEDLSIIFPLIEWEFQFTWITIAAFVRFISRSSLRAAVPRKPVWIEMAEEHKIW